MSATDVAVSGSRPTRRGASLVRQRRLWGLFFLAPWFIGFLAFQLLPILATTFLSFTDYSATKEFKLGNFNMVGLDNYVRLFSDPAFLPVMGATVKYAAIAVPLGLVVPLSFALLVNSKNLIGTNLF